MTEIQIARLDFDKSPDEMDEDELRETITEFKEKHDANVAVFDEIAEDLPDEEEYESLKNESAEFRDRLVGEVAEVSPLAEDDLASFSLTRLYELKAEFAEDEQEAPVDDDEEEEEESPSFTQESKESRAGAFSADDMAARKERAAANLDGMAGLSFD